MVISRSSYYHQKLIWSLLLACLPLYNIYVNNEDHTHQYMWFLSSSLGNHTYRLRHCASRHAHNHWYVMHTLYSWKTCTIHSELTIVAKPAEVVNRLLQQQQSNLCFIVPFWGKGPRKKLILEEIKFLTVATPIHILQSLTQQLFTILISSV